MLVFTWIVVFCVAAIVLAFQRAALLIWTIGLGALLLLMSFLTPPGIVWTAVYWLVFAAIFIPLNVLPLRRKFITKHILAAYRQAMPEMSDTEKEALTAGGVGWTADIFSGMPNWTKFLEAPGPEISDEEQAFLEGPVNELCEMLDNWQISQDMQVPATVLDFIKKSGFFGMIIPKRYGGLEFSAIMHSHVITKVSGVSTAVATILSVPNSLGPAELLLQYGTEEQKNYYLPRLAKGEEIPCFALTSPTAGSDAGSISDFGIICKQEFEGVERTCIKLTWNKRYITLAPIATLLGLAFKLYDPEKILGDKEEYGITCALVPTSTKGVVTGHRHYPLESAFPNGPTQGEEVVIPIDWVIGGASMVGAGWRMLMECLAAGRGISLPSMVTGGAKRAALASGAYARARRQFGTHIGDFGGIQEALARIGSNAYLGDALRVFTVTPQDHGVVPVVASAISKCHATTRARAVINDAMDVHGGKGICMGPSNYLAQGYMEMPISITVEGANILTRSMIIYGQGAIRCHPYILPELTSAKDPDQKLSLMHFDRAFFAHVGFMFSNKVRSLLLGLSHGYLAKAPSGPLKRYFQHFTRFSAALALASDAAMISLGGALKRKEQLSARLGDVLSSIYIGCAVLKHYTLTQQDDPNKEELKVVEYICQDLLFNIQCQLDELIRNFPNRFMAFFLRVNVFPLGKRFAPPSDKLGMKVAKLMVSPSRLRQRLEQGTYTKTSSNNPIGRLNALLEDIIAIEPLLKKVRKAERTDVIKGKDLSELVRAAEQAEILTEADAKKLLKVEAQKMEFINVDDFPPEFFVRKQSATASKAS